MSHILLFEVMDKEPTLQRVWILFVLLGLISFFLGRRVWWASAPVTAAIILFAIGQVSELHDAFVGPDILAEAGHTYVIQSYAAILVSLVLALSGMILGWRRTTRMS